MKKNSPKKDEYEQEIPQSQITDQPMAPRVKTIEQRLSKSHTCADAENFAKRVLTT